MADRVMRISSNDAVRPVSGIIGKSLQRKCAHCEEEEKRKYPIMRKMEAGSSGIAVSSSFASSLNASKDGGAPLQQETKRFMENAFSTDFSSVKIHTGNRASELNKKINAKAFTYGSDIYFREGQYNPGSVEGKHLLGHELTHTIQQEGNSGRKIQRDYATELANPDAVFEGFNGEQIDDAIAFNERQHYSVADIALYRDVLGLNPEPSVIDEDFINAIGEYQAQNNLTVDGKMRLGGETARRLARELKAEGRYLGGREGHELIAAHQRLCPTGVKTVTVDFVRLSGSTRSPAADLAVANRVFRTCCVQFVMRKNVSISLADTQAWLGDTDLDLSGIICGTPTTEEAAMYNGATAAERLSSTMRVFYPATTSGYPALAFSRPPYCAGGFSHHAVIYPGALRDTLAHEFGHILLNSDTHSGIIDPASTRNLMFAPGRTASDLDRTQCATIFNNA